MEENKELSKSDWLIVKSIVNDLLDIPQSEIESKIDLMCQSSSGIKAKVKELMAIHIAKDGQTITPVDSASQVFLNYSQFKSGDVFGKYTIIKTIGSGGMGRVYLAQRTDEVHQQVAIKVLNLEVMDQQAITRFDNERRILATLEHPNITRLIDAGMENNQLYYVMEYIKGEAVDLYCQNRQLTLNERLQLFLKVCDAVSYAHNNLIVHRDLKPSNVLVSEEGEVKLLDFGIAKPLKVLPGTDVIHETLVGSSALTPQYAAPEQLKGENISVSCDVYVLGLLLYRLVTGQHAFEFSGKSWGEIERIIGQDLPVLASKSFEEGHKNSDVYSRFWFRALKGDIDTIISFCLRKEPDSRYRSVDSLASDIKRFQNNDPISVRNKQLTYRIKKHFRKYWLQAVTVFGLMMILLFSYISIRQQRDITIQQRNKAELLSGMFVEAFKNADPTKSNGKNITALEIVNQTEKLISQLEDNDFSSQAELSLTIAEVYRNLGENRKAHDLLKKVEPLIKELSEKEQIKFKSEMVLSELNMPTKEEMILSYLNDAIAEHGPDPLLLYTQSVALRLYVRYQEAEEILAPMVSKMQETDELYIPSCLIFGYVLSSLEKIEKAKGTLIKCSEILDEESFEGHSWDLSEVYFLLGRLYISDEQYDHSTSMFENALDIRGKLIDINSFAIAEIDIFYSDALLANGKFKEALFHAERAYDSRDKHRIENGVGEKTFLAKPLSRIGNYYFAVNQLEKAKKIYEHVIKLRIDGGLESAINTGGHYLKLGEILCKLKLKEGAINAFDKATVILGAPKYEAPDLIITAKYSKAQCLFDLNEMEESKAIVEEIKVDFLKLIRPKLKIYLAFEKLMNDLDSI